MVTMVYIHTEATYTFFHYVEGNKSTLSRQLGATPAPVVTKPVLQYKHFIECDTENK